MTGTRRRSPLCDVFALYGASDAVDGTCNPSGALFISQALRAGCCVDVKLSDFDGVQPDLLVVCEPDQIRPTHVEGAPRLGIEILSVSTQRQGVFSTVGAYTESGILRSPGFPRIELDLNEIFQSLPPQAPLDEVREGVPPYVHNH